MGKSNVVVVVDPKKKPTEGRPRQTEWPVAPLELDDEPLGMLDILLFDGSSELSSEDPSGYAPVKALNDNEDLLLDDTYITSGWIAHQISGHIIQNKSLRDMDAGPKADHYSQQWLGTGPNGKPAILDRDWLKLTKLEDIQANGKVFPVAVMSPNISVTLVDNDGVDIDEANLLSIYRGESEALVSEAGDYPDILGYRWFDQQAVAHLKVEEKTSKGVYLLVESQMHDCTRGTKAYFIYESHPNNESEELRWEIEGVFWNRFDTSDTKNFKVTETPDYTADAIADPVVTLDSAVTTIRVYLMPRPWWGMLRYSEGRSDTCYGVWTLPPKDFEMPAPRTRGDWQTSHYLEFTDNYGQYFQVAANYNPNTEVWRWDNLNSDNAFSNTILSGDDEDCNGFFLFHKFDNLKCVGDYNYFPIMRGDTVIGWRFEYPDPPWPFLSGNESGSAFGLDWFSNWETYPDDSIRRSAIETFCTHPLMAMPVFYVHNGIWTSSPDGKVPTMSVSAEFSPGSQPYYPTIGMEPAVATRNYKVYDPSDEETYLPDETDKIDGIMHHFMSRTFVNKEEDPDSIIFGCAEAAVGDLLAVIEQNESLLYVWRKTPEKLNYSGPALNGPLVLADGTHVDYGDELVIGSLFTDYEMFHRGYYSAGVTGIPCPELANIIGKDIYGVNVFSHFGRIELQTANDVFGWSAPGLIPRILRFGAWVEIDSDYRIRPVLHQGLVDLGPGVRPLFYRQFDQIEFHDKHVQTFSYIAA